MPSHIPQFNTSFKVPLLVAPDFLLPEWCVCFWQDKILAVLMPVPETSIYKYCGPVFLEDNVGRAGQFLYIKSISEPTGKQKLAHKELRFCILAPYALHALAPLLGIHSVCHIVKVYKKFRDVLLRFFDFNNSATPRQWRNKNTLQSIAINITCATRKKTQRVAQSVLL